MPSNNEIRDYLKKNYDYNPKNVYIAHAKEILGIPVKKAPNRKEGERRYKCPNNRLLIMQEAFQHFGMI